MRHRFWLGWALVILLGGCGLRSGTGTETDKVGYFTSPRDAVPRISDMLRNEQWPQLAAYYDLTDAQVERRDLAGGGFFLRPASEARELPPPENELARYRHPFHPSHEYRRTLETDDPDVYVVEVMLEIEQGAGMPPRRSIDYFKMRQSPDGWQVLPDPVAPNEQRGEPVDPVHTQR